MYVSFDDLTESLPSYLQRQPDDRGRDQQQQESKSCALVPVKSNNKLVVDLLCEPERVFASHQRWSNITARHQHEHDNGARHDSSHAMRNDDLPPDDQFAGPEIACGLDERVIQAIHHAHDRQQHKKEVGMDERHDEGSVGIKHFPRDFQQSYPDEYLIDDPTLPENDHPPIHPYKNTYPERNDNEEREETLRSYSDHLVYVEGNGEGDHQYDQRNDNRVARRPDKGQPVDGFFEEGGIIIERKT